MTTPTPDETPTVEQVAEALAVIRRIPGVVDTVTIGAVEQANRPVYRVARALWRFLDAEPELDSVPSTSMIQIVLEGAIERHGLHITTDPAAPGELVGYTSVYPPALTDGWEHDEVHVWGRHDLDAAREFATARTPEGQRVAAVYLLPEGGGR
jgi:hypothetical protein